MHLLPPLNNIPADYLALEGKVSITGRSYRLMTGASIVIGGLLLMNAASSGFDGPIALFVFYMIAAIASQIAAFRVMARHPKGDSPVMSTPGFWTTFFLIFLGIVIGLAALIYLNLDSILKC